MRLFNKTDVKFFLNFKVSRAFCRTVKLSSFDNFATFVKDIFGEVKDFKVLTSHKTPEYDVPFAVLTFQWNCE